jgi:pilus assembly protein Flp/PilA
MARFIAAAKRFIAAEEGASLVEYALLVALIAIACIGGISTLGTNISTVLGNVGTAIGTSS